jgi:hypothetical protein
VLRDYERPVWPPWLSILDQLWCHRFSALKSVSTFPRSVRSRWSLRSLVNGYWLGNDIFLVKGFLPGGMDLSDCSAVSSVIELVIALTLIQMWSRLWKLLALGICWLSLFPSLQERCSGGWEIRMKTGKLGVECRFGNSVHPKWGKRRRAANHDDNVTLHETN